MWLELLKYVSVGHLFLASPRLNYRGAAKTQQYKLIFSWITFPQAPENNIRVILPPV